MGFRYGQCKRQPFYLCQGQKRPTTWTTSLNAARKIGRHFPAYLESMVPLSLPKAHKLRAPQLIRQQLMFCLKVPLLIPATAKERRNKNLRGKRSIQPRCKAGVEICDGRGGAWHGKRMTEMSQRDGESMCKALLFFRILSMRIPERG